MKLTVIGGSARTALQLIPAALHRGDAVTAVVRNAASLTLDHPNLEVAVGDVLDPAALAPLVAGRDAVMFCLGHRDRRPSSVMKDAAQATIWAMEHTGTRRLLAISASGFVRDGNDGFLLGAVLKPVVGRILKNNFDDMRAMESEIVGSDLDWTIVNPPRLTDRPGTGRYRVSRDVTVRRGSTVSRADLADYLLRSVDDESVVRHRMFIAD